MLRFGSNPGLAFVWRPNWQRQYQRVSLIKPSDGANDCSKMDQALAVYVSSSGIRASGTVAARRRVSRSARECARRRRTRRPRCPRRLEACRVSAGIAKASHDGVGETRRGWRIAGCQVAVDAGAGHSESPPTSNAATGSRRCPASRPTRPKGSGKTLRSAEVGRANPAFHSSAIEPAGKLDAQL